MKKEKKHVIGLLLMCGMFLLMPMGVLAKTKTSVTTMTVGKTKVESTYRVKSSNRRVIDIKKQGKKYRAVPKKAGEATLSYYKGKKLAKKVYVLVTNKNTFKYNTSKLVLKQGRSKVYKAAVYKKCTVKYSSSDKKIVTVSSGGKITGVKKGAAIVYVKVYYRGKNIKTFKKKVTVTARKNQGTSGAGNYDSGNDDGVPWIPDSVHLFPDYIRTPDPMNIDPKEFRAMGLLHKGDNEYSKEIKGFTTDYKPTPNYGEVLFHLYYKGKTYTARLNVVEEGFMSSRPYYGKPYVIIGEDIDENAIYTIDSYFKVKDGKEVWKDNRLVTYEVKGKPLEWEWRPSNVHGGQGQLNVKVKTVSGRGWEWWNLDIPCYAPGQVPN